MPIGFEELMDWVNENVNNEGIAGSLMKALMICIGAIEILDAHNLKHELNVFVEKLNEGVG